MGFKFNPLTGNLDLFSELWEGHPFPADPNADRFLKWDDNGGELVWAEIKGAEKIGISVGNGSDTLVTGHQGGYFVVPFDGTIVSWYLSTNQVGNIVFDIWKANASIPTIANTITASAKPTISSGQLANDSTLSGWTTSINTGDVIAYNIDNVSEEITFATLVLYIEK